MNNLTLFHPILVGSDNPLLRKKSSPVKKFDDDLLDLADLLLALMYEKEGLGLSAVQIGEHLRIAAITVRKDIKKKKDKKTGKVITERDFIGDFVMVNPEILEKSPACQTNEEGCLSLPDQFGDVQRSQWIKLKYFTPDGRQITKIIRGRNAVIIQHEIDHMDGILFTDKII